MSHLYYVGGGVTVNLRKLLFVTREGPDVLRFTYKKTWVLVPIDRLTQRAKEWFLPEEYPRGEEMGG